jgi:hypothetical protein
MDLTHTFPRSPKERLGGLVHLPRMIDKARAYSNRTLGEYIYPSPIDKVILEFLQIDAEEFAIHVSRHSDAEVTSWLLEKIRLHTDSENAEINRQILQRTPQTKDRMNYFIELRNKIDPTRTDITTWVDLIDLDENRI